MTPAVSLDAQAAATRTVLRSDVQAIAGGVADFDTLDRVYRHLTGQPLRDVGAAIRLRTFCDALLAESRRVEA